MTQQGAAFFFSTLLLVCCFFLGKQRGVFIYISFQCISKGVWRTVKQILNTCEQRAKKEH